MKPMPNTLTLWAPPPLATSRGHLLAPGRLQVPPLGLWPPPGASSRPQATSKGHAPPCPRRQSLLLDSSLQGLRNRVPASRVPAHPQALKSINPILWRSHRRGVLRIAEPNEDQGNGRENENIEPPSTKLTSGKRVHVAWAAGKMSRRVVPAQNFVFNADHGCALQH